MIIDFTQSEIDTVKKIINDRWKDKNIEIRLADIEYTQENKTSPKMYPALVWEDKSSTFVILKIWTLNYKSFFYYLKNKRFDTGITKYDDLHNCALTLMQSQANFLLSKNKAL